MAVERTCKGKDPIDVELDVGAGEYIEYSVRMLRGAVPNFAIMDDFDNRILGPDDDRDGDGIYSVEWPAEGAEEWFPVTHTFSVSFIAAAKYHYRAVRKRRNDKTAQVLRDCTFWSERARDTDFDGLTIFLKADASNG